MSSSANISESSAGHVTAHNAYVFVKYNGYLACLIVSGNFFTSVLNSKKGRGQQNKAAPALLFGGIAKRRYLRLQ
jgi:hypothetical protein